MAALYWRLSLAPLRLRRGFEESFINSRVFADHAMRALILIPLCLSLSGCYFAFSGRESTHGGVTTTTTAVAASGTAQFAGGTARAGYSFGTPSTPGVPAGTGGSGTWISGGNSMLLVGLVIGEILNYFADGRSGTPPSEPRRDSIAETCSCYGWKPGATAVARNE